MSEINNAQSTLEKAAHDNFPAGAKAGIGSYARSMYENKKHSFLNGAIWQREQDKELAEAAEELLECDHINSVALFAAQKRLTIALRKYFNVKS